MANIGNKIEWLLHSKNISRAQFCKDLNLSDHTVQRILTNKKKLNTDEIQLIAKYFNIEPIELEYGVAKIVFENKDNTNINNQGNIYNQDAIYSIKLLENQIDFLKKINDDLKSDNVDLKTEIKELKSEMKSLKK